MFNIAHGEFENPPSSAYECEGCNLNHFRLARNLSLSKANISCAVDENICYRIFLLSFVTPDSSRARTGPANSEADALKERQLEGQRTMKNAPAL